MMQQLYKECNLVHADLSEYNMLWHDGKVWLIDVSQSVEPTHPHGLEFLFRDCRNVSQVGPLQLTVLCSEGCLIQQQQWN